MKRIINSISIFGISILLLAMQGCYTSRPTASSVSSPDYNKRVNVSGAGYKKKSNGLDIVFNVGLIGVGAYGGYNMNLVQQQTANGKEPVRVANAAIGALAGASVAYLIDQIAGKNKTLTVNDPMQWIKKANKNYKFINGTGQNFSIMHASAENNYTVKNITDVKDFKTAFPNSSQTDEVFQKAINSLDRSSLPSLIDLYPTNQYAGDAKMKYITSSSSYEDIIAAVQKYPVPNAAELCVDKIENINNSLNFANMYGSFNNKRLAVANAFKKEASSVYEINQLKTAYGQDFNLTANDLSNKTENIRGNYFKGLYLLQSPKSIEQFDNFNSQYMWLSYSNKKTDLLSRYWDMINSTYSSGIDVLKNIGNIRYNPIYKDFAINQSNILDVVNQKLKEEAKNNIQILSTEYIGSTNEEWEKWKEARGFSARAVVVKGLVSYIVYGEIQNNSKFDLPLEIDASGMLQAKIITRTANWLTTKKNSWSLLGAIADAVTGAIPNEIKNITEGKASFYIPLLQAHQKGTYAAKIDFGDQEQAGAVNGIMRQEVEFLLANAKAIPNYYSDQILTEQLRKQRDWQYFVQAGLPSTAKVYDYTLYYLKAIGGFNASDNDVAEISQTQGVYDAVNYVGDKVLNYIVEIMNDPSLNYSSSDNSDSSSNDDSRSSNDSSNSKKDDIKIGTIDKNKSGSWVDDSNSIENKSKRSIVFKDGTMSTIHKDKGGKYWIGGGGNNIYFYETEEEAIDAVYVWDKNDSETFKKWNKK